MATGRQGRAERLNERLRGAQRANVNDESFSLEISGLDIGGLAIASSSPALRRTEYSPTTSAKRRRLDKDASLNATTQRPGSTPRRRSTRSQGARLSELPDAPEISPAQNATAQVTEDEEDQEATPKASSMRRKSQPPSSARTVTLQPISENIDEPDALPVPSSVRSAAQLRSPAPARIHGAVVEEVGESPADAPGSGKRRRVPLNEVVSSSVRLLDAMTSDDAFPQSSSPSVRRTRRSDTVSILSNRRSAGTTSTRDESQMIDELSSDRPEPIVADNELSGAEQGNNSDQEDEPAIDNDDAGEEEEGAETEEELPQQQDEPEERDEAEEVDALEAAKVLGRNRVRKPREPSPELGSDPIENDEGDAPTATTADSTGQTAPKRRRGRSAKSPAVQKQPAAAKAKPNKPNKRTRTEVQDTEADNTTDQNQEPQPKKSKTTRRRSGEGEGDDGTIEITVQRFVNMKRRGDGDDGADPLHSEIPFANRGGETVVDVFAQVCDEVISSTLEQVQEVLRNADNTAKKKEYRIKMRAIEAYREELMARFLQHAIHLNHWNSLRKRVRHVQKEKLTLREEILRIREEREQVALRMDAVRIKHEADTKESKYCLDASTLMHDIDLAVEQGKDAPELSRAQQKEAELANLELVVSRISEQASSSSFTGGMLKQVRDFNALLERAAVALESR